ncbi:radical SAM-associated putative lipoprotein [Phocaeicola dorei]|uniref:Radical SAM-associated putative lipoprotein n=1 Tax=Phocaeicola dorei TaxID=357276 RepID=A0AAE4S319_9BACT|nr:radical SAM-associated putative lipoprotein [Phocaeicola dorei]MDU0271615.1 radical SAM-associated putative lipoprotein [Phocaeicola dorei]
MNMKKKMTVHRLLSGALVLLGFASCSNEDENWEIRCEYGTPYSKFLVKGYSDFG